MESCWKRERGSREKEQTKRENWSVWTGASRGSPHQGKQLQKRAVRPNAENDRRTRNDTREARRFQDEKQEVIEKERLPQVVLNAHLVCHLVLYIMESMLIFWVWVVAPYGFVGTHCLNLYGRVRNNISLCFIKIFLAAINAQIRTKDFKRYFVLCPSFWITIFLQILLQFSFM